LTVLLLLVFSIALWQLPVAEAHQYRFAVAGSGDTKLVGIAFGEADSDEPFSFDVYGGYVYVVGATLSFGSYDIFVAKVDVNNGSVVWMTILDNGNIERGYDIHVSADGVFVVGEALPPLQDTGGSRGNPPGSYTTLQISTIIEYDSSAVVVALDPNTGSVMWSKEIGESLPDWANAVFASSGFVYVGGYTESYGGPNGFIARLSARNGNIDWFRTINWSGDDIVNDIYVSGGYVYVTGETTSYSAGGLDAFVAKIDETTGDLIWIVTLGGVNHDGGYAVRVNQGVVYVVGYTNSYGAGSSDAFVAALNETTGDLLWFITIGSSSSDNFKSLDVTPDGKIYAVGLLNTTAEYKEVMVVYIDGTSGTPIWIKTLGSAANDWGVGIEIDNGVPYISGYLGGFGAGNGDAFVIWNLNWTTDSTGMLHVNDASVLVENHTNDVVFAHQQLIPDAPSASTARFSPQVQTVTPTVTPIYATTSELYIVITRSSNPHKAEMDIEVNGANYTFAASSTDLKTYSWGYVLTVKDLLVVYSPTAITSYNVGNGSVTISLESSATVSIAAPSGLVSRIEKDGTVICDGDCDKLRDTDGVISFDPITLTLYYAVPEATAAAVAAAASNAAVLGGRASPISTLDTILPFALTLTPLVTVTAWRRRSR
jgi:hypothetical protein